MLTLAAKVAPSFWWKFWLNFFKNFSLDFCSSSKAPTRESFWRESEERPLRNLELPPLDGDLEYFRFSLKQCTGRGSSARFECKIMCIICLPIHFLNFITAAHTSHAPTSHSVEFTVLGQSAWNAEQYEPFTPISGARLHLRLRFSALENLAWYSSAQSRALYPRHKGSSFLTS